MKSLTTLIVSSSFLLLANCTTLSVAATADGKRSPASDNDWSTCYNSKEDVLYFQREAVQAGQECRGDIAFKADSPDGEPMAMTTPDGETSEAPSLDDMFSGRQGAPQPFTVGGTKLIMTHWGNSSQAKRIIVLIPDFQNRRVITLCNKETLGDKLAFDYNVKSKTLSVEVYNYNKSGTKKGSYKVKCAKL